MTDSRCRRILILALVLVALVHPPTTGSVVPDEFPDLLLRWQLTVTTVAQGSRAGEVLIYRDGLVVQKLLTADTAVYTRGAALSGALARLGAALGHSKVGVVHAAQCQEENPFGEESAFDAVLTWFGKGVRQNRLEFSSGTGPGGACPPQVGAIFGAVLDYLAEINYNEAVLIVPSISEKF